MSAWTVYFMTAAASFKIKPKTDPDNRGTALMINKRCVFAQRLGKNVKSTIFGEISKN